MCDPIRVVIVDDHPLVRSVLSNRLEADDDGVQVVGEAADGPIGLEKATELEPDVVLMDYSMPGMNGAQATRRLLAAQQDVAVIGISTDDRPSVRREMQQAGARGFYLKGENLQRLLEMIRETVLSTCE